MRTTSIALFLSLAIAGCATTSLVVPHTDWETVSRDARAPVDAHATAELGRARAEEAAARAALASVQREVPRAVVVPARPDLTGASFEVVDHERRKADAIARVATANDAWLRARIAWHEQRLAEAVARIPLVEAENELARATFIDRHLLGSDTYDTAGYRGQLARVQARWFDAHRATEAARDALATTSAQLSSLKEEYAQIARRPPTITAGGPRSLQLAGFSLERHVKPTYLKLR